VTVLLSPPVTVAVILYVFGSGVPETILAVVAVTVIYLHSAVGPVHEASIVSPGSVTVVSVKAYEVIKQRAASFEVNGRAVTIAVPADWSGIWKSLMRFNGAPVKPVGATTRHSKISNVTERGFRL